MQGVASACAACYLGGMDNKTIEESADRRASLTCRCNACLDRAMGDLLAEIERLKALAREGWTEARTAYAAEDYGDIARIEAALTEIDTPPRPIDPRIAAAVEKHANEIKELS